MTASESDVAERAEAASAITDDRRRWSDADISRAELARARHALAFLKARLGNARMRELLAPDVATMTAKVAAWVADSKGEWAVRHVELLVPAPSAKAFQAWYTRAWSEPLEAALRAGHPEHFVSHALGGRAEVIENIGETELPWRIFYAPLPDGQSYPVPWRTDFPVRFGSQILDGEDRRVGYTLHELRDEAPGTRMVLTTCLPAAAPAEVLERHLTHFCIEFRNWAAIAALADEETDT